MKKKAAKNEYRLVRGLGDRLGSALIAAAIGGSMAMALIQAMGLSVTVLQAYGMARRWAWQHALRRRALRRFWHWACFWA